MAISVRIMSGLKFTPYEKSDIIINTLANATYHSTSFSISCTFRAKAMPHKYQSLI